MAVILAAALAGFAAMMAWLVFAYPQWRAASEQLGRSDLLESAALVELLAVFMAAIFAAGEVAARFLAGAAAAAEMRSSGRWRLVPLRFVAGLLLVFARLWAGGPAASWTVERTVTT